MKPNRPACLLILLLAIGGALSALGAGAVSGRYPSPYVDHWAFIVSATADLRDGKTDCDPVITAMRNAGLKRFIFSEGTYLFTPGGDRAIIGSDGEVYEGAGPGSTILRSQDDDTGILLSLGSDSIVRNLTLDAFDDASTTGVRLASGKHRATLENVEITDFATGILDGAAVANGISVRDCKLSSNAYGLRTGFASTDIVITGGSILNNTTAGVGLQAGPVGGLITGVLFDGNAADIQMGSCSSYTIAGNTFLTGTTAISVSTGARNSIGENSYGYGEITPANVSGKQCKLRGVYYDTAEPASGTWQQGDVIENRSAGTSGATAVRWFCSTAGTAGSGAVFQPFYRGLASVVGTATWDPGSLATGASEGKDVTVSGAVVGAVALAGHTAITSGMTLNAVVTSSTNVRVTLTNVNATNPTDLASGTVTVRVLQ